MDHFRHLLVKIAIALVAVAIIEVGHLDLVGHLALVVAIAIAVAKLSLASKVGHILKWVAIVILILHLQMD